ncbi:MAG: hypothetical protein DRP93_01230 [Candidatus Neomarinimicrobiota bacterium]|nr:MAG: hypothetical protein DRP93_01230 [Candidatus Neomarinimicrobiota bacterium]
MLKVKGRGTVTLSSPFDLVIPNNLVIEVTGSRTLKDLETAGLDPYKNIYEANGIVSQYDTDLADDVIVYTLQDDSGGVTYVPITYVIGRLDGTGHEFVEKTIGVSLGLIPHTYNLAEIEAKLIETVQDTIGVTPMIKSVDTSATITLNDAEAIVIDRRLATPDMMSCRVRYRQVLEVVDSLQCKNRALMCKIKACCGE